MCFENLFNLNFDSKNQWFSLLLKNFSIWIFTPKMTGLKKIELTVQFFFECQTSLVFVAFSIHSSVSIHLQFFPYVQHHRKVFISSASNIELQERDKFVAKVEKPSKSYKMWNNAKMSNRHLHSGWKWFEKVSFPYAYLKSKMIWILAPKTIFFIAKNETFLLLLKHSDKNT